MITYYRVYLSLKELPYTDVTAESTEEAINKTLSIYNPCYSDIADKILRVVPLKLYKAVRQIVTTDEVELWAEDKEEVERILTDYTDGSNLYDYDSTVEVSTDTQLDIKSIEEE